MFDFLYHRYKTEILKINRWQLIKNMKWYIKCVYVMSALGAFLLYYYSINNIVYGINNIVYFNIGISLFLVGFLLMMFFWREEEQKRIKNKSYEKTANDRLQKVVKLLREFDIDVTSKEHLNDLILLAEKEKEKYDFWEKIREMFDKILNYIIVPIIVVMLSKILEGKSDYKIIILSFKIIINIIWYKLVIIVISISLSDVFNLKVTKIEYFIKDIESIKVFLKNKRNI